jgi:hypothetical protein
VLVFGEKVRLGGWLAVEIVGALIVAAASVELARSPLINGELPDPGSHPEPHRENQPDLL